MNFLEAVNEMKSGNTVRDVSNNTKLHIERFAGVKEIVSNKTHLPYHISLSDFHEKWEVVNDD